MLQGVTKSSLLTCLLLVCSCGGNAPLGGASPTPTPISTKIEDAAIVDVVPQVDGGVYALSSEGKLWFIQNGAATPVKTKTSEVSIARPIDKNFDASRSYFALWASERYRHKQTKRASEQEPEYPEPDGYDDPNR